MNPQTFEIVVKDSAGSSHKFKFSAIGRADAARKAKNLLPGCEIISVTHKPR